MSISSDRYSALIIEPKKEFLEWLEIFLNKNRSYAALEELYYKEENAVWLIPPIGSFSSDDDFDNFVNSQKSKLLRVELNRFGVAELFLNEKGDSCFDQYFDLVIRDTVNNIGELT
ncbi:MAG: hypothetical protein AAGA18_14905 [Verrucomicrobiota bacterium]